MTITLLALCGVAVIAPAVIRRLGRDGFLLLAVAPALGILSLLGDPAVETTPWVPSLHMDLVLRADPLSTLLALIVLGGGALVLVYCARYFDDSDAHLPGFAAKMVGFAAAMYGLVLSDNMLVMYVFWEITSVLSFLLVGHFRERASSRRAATQALLVTVLGGLAMLVGIIGLGTATGSYRLSDVVAAGAAADGPPGAVVTASVFCVLVGALSKSAIAPLHFWLPGAMAAPTPVSAYLHSAAMVKAGVYLMARLAPGYADVPGWRLVLISLGLLTLVMAAWRAMHEFDLKLILAFGTVSQLGFLTVVIGVGTADALTAGLTMLVAHALFKAALFMVVGIIDHATGTRDIRALSGLGRRSPTLALVATAAAFSMAGLPPLLGFVGKESALSVILSEPALHGLPGKAIVVGLATGSILTVGYSLRFLYGAFGVRGGALTSGVGASAAVRSMGTFGPVFLGVPALLALAGVACGARPEPVARLVESYTAPLPGASFHVELWHGPTIAAGVSAVVLAAGLGLHLADRFVGRIRFDSPPLGNADRFYDAVLGAADTASLRLTAFTQRGSLPLNLATVFAAFVAFPGLVLLFGDRAGLQIDAWHGPVQVVLAVIVIAATLAAVLLRNRLSAVLAVGVTGYAIAFLFAYHGAPDLALTQVLVETLLLVTFVLVLRKLPADVDVSRNLPRSRGLLAIAVGTATAAFGAYSANARVQVPVSATIPGLAYDEGGGANAVNVLLVDIRAWDTLGEVAVVLAAATGVASLVFRSHRWGRTPGVADARVSPVAERRDVFLSASQVRWLRGNTYTDLRLRSLVLEVGARMLFPTMMVLSVYFLFAGHNNPGGGFAGGLVAGLALVLRYFAGGRYELGEAMPIEAGHLLGSGLLLAAGSAVVPLFLGEPALSSAIFTLDLPVFGAVKVVTAVVFDIGVYLIVLGFVLDVLRSLGARLEYPDAMPDTDAPPLPPLPAAPAREAAR